MMTEHRSDVEVGDDEVAGFPAIVGRPVNGVTQSSPVVLLHGAFADQEAFRGWVGRFAAAGYLAVAPARRGRIGIGPDRAAGLTFDDYVADVSTVLDCLDAPPFLIGHSLGGLLAQKLAEQGRARGIALLASAPPFMLTAQRIALPRFGPQLPRIITGRPFIVGNDACNVLALNRVPEPERPAIHAHLTHESGKVYRSLMFGTVRVKPAKVTVPVFVGGGTDDHIVSASITRRIARHYGTAPHLYEGRGHWLIEEPGWDRLADEVLAWMGAAA